MYSSAKCFRTKSRKFASIFIQRTEFRIVFSSGEWFGIECREFASIFVPRYGIPSIFLLRGKVRNGIPRVCFYFCSMVWNSEHFSFPWNGSEQNSKSFRFRRTAGISSEQTICFIYSTFHGINFLPEIPNLFRVAFTDSYSRHLLRSRDLWIAFYEV